MPGRTVKNAPYSADVVTESTHTLADGNHVRQSSTSHLYRDSEGRTRQEQSLKGLSSVAGNANLPAVVFIHDPVAGASYALSPSEKSASKMAVRPFRGGPPPDGAVNRGQVRDQSAAPRERGHFQGRGANNPNVKTETLPRQTIEGVPADGTRTTLTIPAGEMGNELPIQVVTERWYSPDLQTFVLTKHSDPRTGDTVTRLTNIIRSEPSRTLFEVPADYKVTENTRQHPMAGPAKQ